MKSAVITRDGPRLPVSLRRDRHVVELGAGVEILCDSLGTVRGELQVIGLAANIVRVAGDDDARRCMLRYDGGSFREGCRCGLLQYVLTGIEQHGAVDGNRSGRADGPHGIDVGTRIVLTGLFEVDELYVTVGRRGRRESSDIDSRLAALDLADPNPVFSVFGIASPVGSI
jgi:hypothetical protein